MVMAVEGSIGAGKSTLATTLGAINQQPVVPETVNNMFLQHFYGDPTKYGFPFQLYMLVDRLAKALMSTEHTVQDRSLLGDYVFAQAARQMGNIDADQFAIYQNILQSSAPTTVHTVVYIHSTTATCMANIVQRGRVSEQNITVDYLALLDQIYFETLMLWVGGSAEIQPLLGPPPRLVVVDACQAYPDADKVQTQLKSGNFPTVAFIARTTPPADTTSLYLPWQPHLPDSRARALTALANGRALVFVRCT